LSSRKPIGRRLYETENSGGNWTRRRREGRGEKFSGENPLRDHSSRKPRIEAGLAENKKAPSVGHMALILEKMVEVKAFSNKNFTYAHLEIYHVTIEKSSDKSKKLNISLF
jgi:hypothetical protein